MSSARACVLVEPNRIETWDVPIFDPPPGGALVRIVAGGVCGSDVHIANGEAGIMPFPIILGHEGVGRVERLGAGVETDYAGVPIKVGDLVYWAPIALCHRCHSCTVLEETPCENSQFFEHADKPNWGSYADFAVLPNGLAFFRVPDGTSSDAVIALGCALPTVLRGFDRCGQIRMGDTVVVQGAGPVGLSAVLVARLCGAREIVVIDAHENRLGVARTLGATATISLADSAAERKRQLYDRVASHGPDVVVEAAGVLQAFPEGFDLAGNHGRYIILGLWGAIGTQAIPPRELSTKNLTVAGASFPKPKHYHAALQLASRLQHDVPLAALVTHRFGIADAAAALEATARGEVIKAIIAPEQGGTA